MSKHLFFFLAAFLFCHTGWGQQSLGLPENPVGPGFDPAAVFAPGFYSDLRLPSRSANGAPGPGYWQNRADYTIQAKLDTIKK